MAATLNTTQFLLTAARDAFADLRRSDKSDRTNAVRDLLAAETAEQRDDVVAEYGAWLVRKGLRVAALSSKDEEVANVFWMLRDSIDDDGLLEFDDVEAIMADEVTDEVTAS